MSTLSRITGIILLIAGCVSMSGCEERREARPLVWLTNSEVTRAEVAPADSMAADVYLDATLSMTGYVSDPDSAYVQMLDGLEGSLANKWKKTADLRYYKFGKSVRQITREEFRGARKKTFYSEKGIFETTDINLVASKATPQRITIAITDLFQGDQDLNPMVSSIRDNVFSKKMAVGILAVDSEFDGKVYDARVPSFHYASSKGSPATDRPFYLIMFGDAAGIEQLVAALAQTSFVNRAHFLLISPYVVRRYQVSATKKTGAKGLKARAATGEADEFSFDVRTGSRGGLIDAEVHLDLNPNVADFQTDAIDVMTGQTALGKSETGDVSLQSITRNGSVLKASLLLDNGAQEGKYSYDVRFRLGKAGHRVLPKWVDELSSDNPTPTKDSNRTLNLKRLVTELIDGCDSIQPPPLAKLRLNVRKLN